MLKLKKYDKFLYGKSMISQRESKLLGQQITYYEIISINGNNVEYKPVYDILEKE